MKRKYAGLGMAELRRLKQLDEGEPEAQAAGGRSEPRQEDAAGRALKTALRPDQQRTLVHEVRAGYAVSERRACAVLRTARSTARYQSVADDRAQLRIRLRDLATVVEGGLKRRRGAAEFGGNLRSSHLIGVELS